ncbi:TolB family protein [Kordiimonas gwangyangensis]|uniref:TolB family protein n=1 Tax=Kordiimonas gwangyangensis TaxID=288022 RepID=UPI0003A3AD91|nr:PD40 domain-containing protein [Kordiimonas gwangyangensis]
MKTICYVLASVALSATAVLAQDAPTRELVEFSSVNTDVKLTISPDGQFAVWGVGTDAGLDLFMSRKTKDGWGATEAVPFNTAATEFDPSFAPDGRSLLFFSDREGGFGGDDLYEVSFDAETGSFGKPANLGGTVNSKGDDWAPVLNASGTKLLFASDGHGGYGKHDLFISDKVDGAWATPKNLGPAINSAREDFDAAFLPGDSRMVYSQGTFEGDGDVRLRFAEKVDKVWSKKSELPKLFNCRTGLNFGPSVSAAEPDWFYWSATCKDGRGKSDIWRAPITALGQP